MEGETPKRRGRTLTKQSGAKGPGYVSKLSHFSKNTPKRVGRSSIRGSIVGRKSIIGGRKSIIFGQRGGKRRASRMNSRFDSYSLGNTGVGRRSILGNGHPMTKGRKSIVMSHKRKSIIPNPILKNKSPYLAIRGRKKKLSVKPVISKSLNKTKKSVNFKFSSSNISENSPKSINRKSVNFQDVSSKTSIDQYETPKKIVRNKRRKGT